MSEIVDVPFDALPQGQGQSDVDAKWQTSKPCPCLCPEGSACCLRGDIKHSFHVCFEPSCACHSEVRYEAAKRSRALDRLVGVVFEMEA